MATKHLVHAGRWTLQAICSFLKHNLSQITQTMWRLSTLPTAIPKFVRKVYYGDSVEQIRWLIRLDDTLLLEKSGYRPGTMRLNVIV